MLAANMLQSGAGAWNPRLLGSTLIGFYESDTGVLQSSGLVSQWTDLSGNGNSLLASSANPSFVSSSNAGFPAISFNGLNNKLDVAIGGLHTILSAFAVLATIGTNGSTAAFISGMRLYLNDGTANQLTVAITGTPISGQTITAPAQVGCVVHAANNIDFWRGTSVANKTTGSSFTNAALTLGADPSGVQWSKFDIQSLVLCDTALSGPNVTLLQAYFTRKYGV